MEKRCSQKRNRFRIGTSVKIINPGYNRPTAYRQAKQMNSKWYRQMTIGGRPEIYRTEGWYIAEVDAISDVFLIRNENLRLDLVVERKALGSIKSELFSDGDFTL